MIRSSGGQYLMQQAVLVWQKMTTTTTKEKKKKPLVACRLLCNSRSCFLRINFFTLLKLLPQSTQGETRQSSNVEDEAPTLAMLLSTTKHCKLDKCWCPSRLNFQPFSCRRESMKIALKWEQVYLAYYLPECAFAPQLCPKDGIKWRMWQKKKMKMKMETKRPKGQKVEMKTENQEAWGEVGTLITHLCPVPHNEDGK